MKTITNIKGLYNSEFDVIREWFEGKIKSTYLFEIGDYTFDKERILHKGIRIAERIDEYVFVSNKFKYWRLPIRLKNSYICDTLPDTSVFKNKLKFFSWFTYNFTELNKYSFQGVSIRKDFINNNRVTVDRSYIDFDINFCPKEYINKYKDVLSKFIKVDVEAKIYTGFKDYRYGEYILGYYRIGDILNEGANLFLSRREIQFYELKRWHIKNCQTKYKKYTLKESIVDYNDIRRKQDRQNKVEEFKQYKIIQFLTKHINIVKQRDVNIDEWRNNDETKGTNNSLFGYDINTPIKLISDTIYSINGYSISLKDFKEAKLKTRPDIKFRHKFGYVIKLVNDKVTIKRDVFTVLNDCIYLSNEEITNFNKHYLNE